MSMSFTTHIVSASYKFSNQEFSQLIKDVQHPVQVKGKNFNSHTNHNKLQLDCLYFPRPNGCITQSNQAPCINSSA